jgi:hypothetical protein
MADRFWVGGSGTWDAATTTHWATASGGGGGASAPTSSDDAYFDTNSTSSAVQISGGVCKNLICQSGFTGKFQGSGALTIAGSMTFVSGMATVTSSGTWTFTATTSGQTITSAGQPAAGGFTFNGVGGVWTLQDALTLTGSLTLTNGSLNTNGKTVTCAQLSSNNTNTGRVLTLDSSSVIINGANNTPLQFGVASNVLTGLTWSVTGTTFRLNTTGTGTYTFNINTLLIPSLTIAGPGSGAISIAAGSGNNTINNLLFLPGASRTINFNNGSTFTITASTIVAPDGNVVTLQSSSAGSQFTLAKSGGGTVECSGVKIKDCIASPASTFIARGISGANLGNNTNWSFSSRLKNSTRTAAASRTAATTRTVASARTALVE